MIQDDPRRVAYPTGAKLHEMAGYTNLAILAKNEESIITLKEY